MKDNKYSHLSQVVLAQIVVFTQIIAKNRVSILNGMAAIEFTGISLVATDAKRVKKPKLPKKRLLKKTLRKKGR